jgi:hypothetical protein
MTTVSTFRLYVLRAMYLLIVAGLGMYVWPEVISRTKPWELMEGVVVCMLAAFWLLSALGLRYPLQMLPVLLWELVWKALWLLMIALPLWRTGEMDAATTANAISCLFVILVPFAIPWRYVIANYVTKGGDAWRRPTSATPATSR